MDMAASLPNPKVNASKLSGKASWYPYYAGFSLEFARGFLERTSLPEGSQVLDLWNGSGTTTEAALDLGLPSVGYDLNPAMIVIAKARLVTAHSRSSLSPLANEIVASARLEEAEDGREEPLRRWFARETAHHIRKLEGSISRHLVPEGIGVLAQPRNVELFSDLAGFFYTALFRAVRLHLKPFVPTNPTWVKVPKSPSDVLAVDTEAVNSGFLAQVKFMADSLELTTTANQDVPAPRVVLSVAPSEDLPLGDSSVECVLTSPPYCTRIDYAVATLPELAVLGFGQASFDSLRRSLTGSATVEKATAPAREEWGFACNAFLKQVHKHSSKASKTYYYKQHVQYFRSLFTSLREIGRVLKKDGICGIVVQDSYYKDVYNPLPDILLEMATNLNFEACARSDFSSLRTFARMNPQARKYRSHFRPVESVLVFEISRKAPESLKCPMS